MRSKEDAHDYRYFPNPDLPAVLISSDQLELWRSEMPELPEPRTARFQEQYGLSADDAANLVSDKQAADFFESAVAFCKKPKRGAGWMQAEFRRECAGAGFLPSEAPITPAYLAELAQIIENGTISPRMAHDIFAELFASGASPEQFVKDRGLVQVSDTGELEGFIN